MFDQKKTGLAAGLLVEAQIMDRKRRVLGHAHKPVRRGKSFLLLPLDGEEFVKVSIADWAFKKQADLDEGQQTKLADRRRQLWHYGIAIEYGTMVHRTDEDRSAVVVSQSQKGTILEVLTSPIRGQIEHWDVGISEVVSYWELGVAGSTWISQLHSMSQGERSAYISLARQYKIRN
jgi:hypothetical protein